MRLFLGKRHLDNYLLRVLLIRPVVRQFNCHSYQSGPFYVAIAIAVPGALANSLSLVIFGLGALLWVNTCREWNFVFTMYISEANESVFS